jgi:hypothetical protein
MEEELVVKPLLVKQEPDNISISNHHGGIDSDSSSGAGAGATVRPSDSRVTVILVISTFVAACSGFTGGCTVSTIIVAQINNI